MSKSKKPLVKKSEFERTILAIKDIHALLARELRATRAQAKKTHYECKAKGRFDAYNGLDTYEYGFMIGRYRQAREMITKVTKIVMKM